jgi:indole-3-glycerol phosphate synthase
VIRPDFQPVDIARAYQQGGASCLSVLTDVHYFQGSDDYVKAIREQVDLPILRKDFMLDPYQLLEARAMGADAVLIIMAMLDDAMSRELADTAAELELSVLVEVHDAQELERALRLNTTLMGINNRNLHNFETNLQTTLDLLHVVPSSHTVVSESGIHTAADIQRMNDAGVYAFLIGESLMRQVDPGSALRNLLQV